MSRPASRHSRGALVGVLAILALVLSCSTDSPTAPEQQPGPPPGTTPPSAVWNITITVDPGELTAGSDQPATVSVRVRRADTGVAPVSGTTMVISTSLGDFLSLNSGIQSVAIGLTGGRASLLLFAGSVTGTALISGQLERSVGQVSFPIVAVIEPVVAAFSSQNTEENLSVQFLNESEGNPTSFLWDFGDGSTSTEEHPNHLFPNAGDFVVSLTASKTGSSDTFARIETVGRPNEIFIDFISPDSGPADGGTTVTITGNGFRELLRVFFGSKLGDVRSVTSTRIRVIVPAGDLATESCQKVVGTETVTGTRVIDTPVDVTVELEDGPRGSVSGGYTYLAPAGAPCVTG